MTDLLGHLLRCFAIVIFSTVVEKVVQFFIVDFM